MNMTTLDNIRAARNARNRVVKWATEQHPWMGESLQLLIDSYPMPMSLPDIAVAMQFSMNDSAFAALGRQLAHLELKGMAKNVNLPGHSPFYKAGDLLFSDSERQDVPIVPAVAVPASSTPVAISGDTGRTSGVKATAKPEPELPHDFRRRVLKWATEQHPWMGAALEQLIDSYPNTLTIAEIGVAIDIPHTETALASLENSIAQLELKSLLWKRSEDGSLPFYRAADLLFGENERKPEPAIRRAPSTTPEAEKDVPIIANKIPAKTVTELPHEFRRRMVKWARGEHPWMGESLQLLIDSYPFSRTLDDIALSIDIPNLYESVSALKSKLDYLHSKSLVQKGTESDGPPVYRVDDLLFGENERMAEPAIRRVPDAIPEDAKDAPSAVSKPVAKTEPETPYELRRRLLKWATEQHPWMGDTLKHLFNRYPLPSGVLDVAEAIGVRAVEEEYRQFMRHIDILKAKGLIEDTEQTDAEGRLMVRASDLLFQ